MEVKIVTKEVIKPSSLIMKTYNLSFLDQQFYGAVYNKLFLFYQNSFGISTEEMISEKAQCLKASLSEVLSDYYPLAGKTKDKYSVFTGENDGVEFIEARVNGTLSEYLVKPDVNLFLAKLVSEDYCESFTRPLLIIQASFFVCGGLAIRINISHRVADAASFTRFINAWAGTAIRDYNIVEKPDFSGSLIFPPSNHFVGAEALQDLVIDPNLATRRFVFSSSNIISLQEKATKLGTITPSRVLTISAFLWRIGMKMSTSKYGGYGVPSTLTIPINLRSVLSSPISDQSFGNLFEAFTVDNQGGNTEISNLTTLIRNKMAELREIFQNKIQQREENLVDCLGSFTEKLDLTFKQDVSYNFVFSSWCKFPLYEANFGWGKPTWIANYNRARNCAVLMDTSDGTGIEAWVSLSEDDMVLFASNEELLAYATLDPNVD